MLPLDWSITDIWIHFLRHVLDIYLVAYIFYRLLLLVQGTRSVQILQGVLFLAVGTVLVNQIFHLPMSRWLLEKFWMAGIVLLAIVFQSEIRSALAYLGSQPLSRWILPSEFKFIDEIVHALQECSDKRIGALIVFEQETGLKNYIETGTRINGEISLELILSLLHPRSVLHDGAIIISGNQLVAAGCVLPLTEDPDFSKTLGTRHRAAVGLSEYSDAIVLVVSEETGQLSVARDGRLQRGMSFDDLRKEMRDLVKARANQAVLRRFGPREENG